ncbi:MAG: hypothetical protein VKN33_10865 [Candidatus Sericytochromatia bacterium]|nr:hypothetical protein [Candidatus Sericytochromatia bacterium]
MVKPSARGPLLLAFAISACTVPPSGTATQAAPPSPPNTVEALPSAAPALSVSPKPELQPSDEKTGNFEYNVRAEINGKPVTAGLLTVYDLATGEPIPLQATTSERKLRRLFTDFRGSEGRFRFRIPDSSDGQSDEPSVTRALKLVVTGPTGTLCAIIPETPSSALAPISRTGDIVLNPPSTVASQSFEGIIKLTFRLPPDEASLKRAELFSAMLQASTRAETALSKRPSALRPLLESIDITGNTKKPDAFRQSVQDLQIFSELFEAIRGHLLDISTRSLLSPQPKLSPIQAHEFPLDEVIISSSGLLGFSGQRAPIQLGQQGASHSFVPTPPRGGGGGNASVTPPPAVRTPKVFELDNPILYVYDLAFLRGRNEIAVARRNPMMTLLRLSDESETDVGFGLGDIWTVSQMQAGSETLCVGTDGGADQGNIYSFAPNTNATAPLSTFGPRPYRLLNGLHPLHVLEAGKHEIYVRSPANASVNSIERIAPNTGLSQGEVTENGTTWLVNNVTAIALHEPESGASPTLFVGTEQGEVFMQQDGGASFTISSNVGGAITGLTFATPSLYAAIGSLNKVISLQPVASSSLAGQVLLDANDAILSHLDNPRGLTTDDDAQYLYVGTNGATKTIIRYPLPLPTP